VKPDRPWHPVRFTDEQNFESALPACHDIGDGASLLVADSAFAGIPECSIAVPPAGVSRLTVIPNNCGCR